MAEYVDIVHYRHVVYEAAYRAGSVELNVDEGCWEGFRVYKSGSWRIRSAPCGKLRSKPRPSRGDGLRDAVLYAGVYEHRPIRLEADELLGAVEASGASCSETGCTCEAILEYVEGERRIEHYEGEAIHRFSYLAATLGAVAGAATVSDTLPVSSEAELRLLPRIARVLCEKARMAARGLKRLSPMESGRWSVVLVGTAAAVLAHELAHLLAGDRGPRLPLGARIAPEELSMRDEPGYAQAPYHHVFDDEAVVAARRSLVALGEVRGYLGVRWRGVGEPGSARGLFQPPIAMHTVLVLEAGDWRDSEIVEETRRGVLVETVAEAWVDENGVITMIPELAWLVEGGEVVGALRFSRLRLRAQRELATIDALGRRLWARFAREKGQPLVELAPSIRLQAYVD